MNGMPYYYLILCVDGFREYMISDVQLNPRLYANELIREIPDSMNYMHRVDTINPALRQNYDAHQKRLARKARRA